MSSGYNNLLNGRAKETVPATIELPVAELLMRGRELVRFLRSHGELHWSEWLQDSLEIVRRDPRHGVVIMLDGFEGIGAITDIYLCPEAGHRLAGHEENAINEELLLQVSRVYTLVRELGDFVDADSLRRARAASHYRL
ncbi:MAG: hypothetical protein KJO55_07210 [Gammaproteobacteria bacterium]|nr:hypothetical protein [Gammaproteobacteria bacterium]NND61252.1 hypothetical protein [Gammaproteobacteria bacterium]